MEFFVVWCKFKNAFNSGICPSKTEQYGYHKQYLNIIKARESFRTEELCAKINGKHDSRFEAEGVDTGICVCDEQIKVFFGVLDAFKAVEVMNKLFRIHHKY